MSLSRVFPCLLPSRVYSRWAALGTAPAGPQVGNLTVLDRLPHLFQITRYHTSLSVLQFDLIAHHGFP